MLKLKFILLLIGTTSFLLTACRHKNDPLWNEVVDYFTDPAGTKQELINRLSPLALQSILRQSNADTIESITDFFENFRYKRNYRVDETTDTVYVTFNPDDEIEAGPSFQILKSDTSWLVIDIRFGK